MPKVQDIMTTDVETAEPDTTLEEVASMMKEGDVGSIPVVEDEELVGIITDRDIVVRCIAEGKDPAETTVEEILSEELETAEPEMDVEDAARLMAQRQVRRLPVVENNRLIGMLSLGDIAVKHGDEGVSGEALEDISEGVKSGGRKQPQGASRGGGSARGRQEISARGREQRSSGGRASSSSRGGRAAQGTSSRAQSSERGAAGEGQPGARDARLTAARELGLAFDPGSGMWSREYNWRGDFYD